MSRLPIIVFALLLCSVGNSVDHKSRFGITVLKTFSQNILGKNFGYYVELRNDSQKTVDAIEWQARFYNNFEDLKVIRKGNWSSGNFISPVKTGESVLDLEGDWVDDATKVYIEIIRVHFTDGTTLRK
ncbi:MAG: hypothetical protein RIT43_1050 [Bacteroidota bacterium]